MTWWEQGFTLMFIGMGTVFVFLWLLVYLMNISAWFFKKYAHLFPEEQDVAQEDQPKKRADDGVDIAVAIAAVQAFRSRN